MTDLIHAFFANYGATVMTWACAILATAGAWLLVRLGLSAKWKALILELGVMARDIVLEVWQTYVEALKKGREDGRLTPEEAATARTMALTKLRERLSWSKLATLGGGLLMRLFAGSTWAEKVNSWLVGAVETQVAAAKLAGKTAGLITSGTAVKEPLPLPPP